MTKTEIIQEVIGNTIKPYGFAYLGIEDGAWIYRKELGDLRQDIDIRLMSKDQLNLYFSTNAPLQRPCCADELIKEGERRGNKPFGYFRFTCEQEFIEVIEYFKKIIFDYGVDALDKRSVPATEIRPTKETNSYLFENHEELNRRYREKFNIDKSTEYTVIFQIIQEYLIQTQGREFSDVLDTLIGLAAVVGTVIADASDGVWEWDSRNNICWVSQKQKYPRSYYPLGSIINRFREKPEHTFNSLNAKYNYMKEIK